MKQLILIGGDLAAGKSTLSNIIAKEIGVPCCNKDTIKEILGDSFGFTNREENLRLSRTTFSLMYYFARKTCEAGGNLILESNFRQRELDTLQKLAKQFGYAIKGIVLQADIDELYRRFQNRIENENRHAVHKAVPYNTVADFKVTIDEWREITYPGMVLTVDNTDFSAVEGSKFEEIITFLRG